MLTAEIPETRETLKLWLEAGVDECLADIPLDLTSLPVAKPPVADSGAGILPSAKPAFAGKAAVVAATAPPISPPILTAAPALTIEARSLEALASEWAAFDGCLSLKRGASHFVFAAGVAAGGLMLVGDAPGADEDRAGQPFVGKAGQLLDRILAAVRCGRDTNSYLTNLLPWRPPGNRSPTEAEISACLPFVRRHIALVAPKLLVLLGGAASKALLASSDGITKLRGRDMVYRCESGRDIPAIASFHPLYLLQQPASKKQAWADWRLIEKRLTAL